MVFERFTDRARRVTVLAQEEARQLSHNYIGTEHILLGLLHEGEGVAAQALVAMGIKVEDVRTQVEQIIGQGQQSPAGHIPFTPRAKKVMELSLREALQLGHNYIGTEHILLGLLREGEGVAAQVLGKLGCELVTVRQKVIELLSKYQGKEPPPPPVSPGTPIWDPTVPQQGYVKKLLMNELTKLFVQIRDAEINLGNLRAQQAEIVAHLHPETLHPETPAPDETTDSPQP
jgi:ATP-dependent Clp protease ATP-binding subunit ClpC